MTLVGVRGFDSYGGLPRRWRGHVKLPSTNGDSRGPAVRQVVEGIVHRVRFPDGTWVAAYRRDTMSTQEPRTERSNERSVAGGGEVSYTVSHRQEDHADSLASKIETAIEMCNAWYFQSEPRERLGTRMPVTSEYKIRHVTKAVEEANDRQSFAKNVEGEMEYIVEEAYYPDEYSHYIDVTDIPEEGRSKAFLHAQSALCGNGYAINSIRTNDEGLLTKFHVVSLTWVYDARSHRRQKEE